MVNLRSIFRDYAYLYILTVLAWIVFLSGWTISQGESLTVGVFTGQWFMLVVIALVMIVPTFAYRWSKENLP